MPFNYYDTNGFLAIGPTIPQWRELRAELTGPEGEAFADAGQTNTPLALADEIETDGKTEPVATLLLQLKRAAEKADTSLFLTTGTSTEAQ